MPSCPEGKIWRVPHTRGSKKSSKKVSVKGKCIPATSQTGKKTSVEVKKKLSKIAKSQESVNKKFKTPKCKKGEVVRSGYKRTSKSGKKIVVPPTCIKDVGKPGKVARSIYIEPDRLGKYGYNDLLNRSDQERHRALGDAVTAGEKPLSMFRRLVALSTLTRNTNPAMSTILRNDATWIQATQK
jgi:hypothetical protein